MSTHPILPDTKVPFPCWLYVAIRPPGARFTTKTWHYVTHDIDAGWLVGFCTHYSTLPPSQLPDGVPNDAVTESTPHPTLAQLAEGAAKKLLGVDGLLTTYRCADKSNGAEKDVAAAIVAILSPEWERMAQERDEARGSVYRCKQIEITALVRDLAALRSENERLTKELGEARNNWATVQTMAANMSTRLRELEEDRAKAALPIDESNLLLLGFRPGVDEFGSAEFSYEAAIDEPSDFEWAELLVRRGNGTDPSCWDIRFRRRNHGFVHPVTVALKYGAREVGEVVAAIRATDYRAARKGDTQP